MGGWWKKKAKGKKQKAKGKSEADGFAVFNCVAFIELRPDPKPPAKTNQSSAS